jgi:uncharacterized membrane protein
MAVTTAPARPTAPAHAPARARTRVRIDSPRREREPFGPIVVGAVFALANNVALTGGHPRFLGPALVFWLMVVYPAYVLAGTDLWGERSVAERLAYGLVGVLLLLIVGGLAINTFLPPLGVARPLDTVPVLILVDSITVGLWLLRRRRPAPFVIRYVPGRRAALEIRLVLVSAVCVPLMVLGANRLNNGDGNTLTMIGLALAIVVFVLLLVWAQRLRAGMTALALYLLSASMLLMTSLRGWSVTGHDVQLEYRVFQLTAAHGRWSMSTFRNPYNACLSITLLPTQMAALLHVDDAYVYKVFFQLLFAFCPVMVFTLARRYFSDRVAILAVAYFIGFPTFFTDLPFLNRQEMALLFVAASFLILSNATWTRRRRQLFFVLAAVGVELCHYSTSYVFVATLVLAWLGQTILARGWPPQWRRSNPPALGGRWLDATRAIGLGSLLVILAVVAAWGGLATKTANGVGSEVTSALSGVFDRGGAKSSSVQYGLLSGGGTVGNQRTTGPGGNQALLDQYRQQTLRNRSAAVPGTFIPLSVVDQYDYPAVAQPNIPVTGAGRLLAHVHLTPSTVNNVMRATAAKGEQLFLLIGLVALVAFKRRRGTVTREYFYLCCAGVMVLAAVTFLPNLSVDYGLLRVFQQELILIAPVIVVGSLTLFQILGTWWRNAATGAVGLAFFASTTGLVPQALGGYPAQLNLNDSGQYYDLYYMIPQEVAAVNWLAGKPGTLPGGIQADFTSERFAFTSPNAVTGQQYLIDLYPTFLELTSWVIVDSSMLQTRTATVSVDGDLVAYRYPFGLLQREKNLVFDDGKTQIYQ